MRAKLTLTKVGRNNWNDPVMMAECNCGWRQLCAYRHWWQGNPRRSKAESLAYLRRRFLHHECTLPSMVPTSEGSKGNG